MSGQNPKNIPDIAISMADSFVELVRERPFVAGTLWAGVFLVFLSLSLVFGIVPKIDMSDSSDTKEKEIEIVSTETVVAAPAASDPARILIDDIELDAPITIPESRAIEALDQALLNGVVHYPGSAQLGEEGNVLLFGHSTGFRVVQNQAFKVFNNLKELEENDLIRLQSTSREYVYRVTSVRLVNADEELVDLSARGRRLTLSTCNTFGAKQERYVVEAEFVGDYSL